VRPELITVIGENVRVEFTPTIPNCTMATLIGLMIRVKLYRSLPQRFKVDVYIENGKHEQQAEINKQLNDKERVLAALENANLLSNNKNHVSFYIEIVNKGLFKAEKGLEDYLKAYKIEF
jgi:hypothetical protein